ncbi:MAG TPA: 50S ribosomal protein L29 [Nitrolancea sp.]|jgi:large subunit ribosomal protein L29|nr:50S ribosomal protein L29 [Nitrolancea sp.]
MKANELRGMTDAELVGTIDDLKSEWRDLRFDAAIGKITNTTRIRKIKRDIARIKTIQTERVMAAELERMLGE